MNRRDMQFLTLAGEAAQALTDKDPYRLFYLGCVAIRADGRLVRSRNQSIHHSPQAGKKPYREAHAEYRVCRKLDYGAEVFVTRVRSDGTWGLSRPCENCMKILTTSKVKRICYTIGPQEYGVIVI